MDKRVIESGIEIFLLVLASFAFAYIIYENDKPLIPLVKAQSTGQVGCCQQLINGAVCSDTSQDQCASGFSGGVLCSGSSSCSKVCCEDLNVGTFDKNVPKYLCEDNAAQKSYPNAACNVPGAKLGCCFFANGDTGFITSGQCDFEKRNGRVNESMAWRGDVSEVLCVASSLYSDIRGACITGIAEDGRKECKVVTREECVGLSGGANFYAGALCTAEALNTTCEKTSETTCANGKDEVYFKDSCGNSANIYDSSKLNNNSYWESVYSKSESCGYGNGNGNSSSCGNCVRTATNGGLCSSADENNFNVDGGDFYCKKTSCTYDGTTYKNGESWCGYDGVIDSGDDVVGSRHFRYICSEGEIQVEPCADFRNQICVQRDRLNDTSTSYNTAVCRTNNWRKCIDLNGGKENLTAKCTAELDCEITKINLGKSFKFDVCTPRYPEGFAFNANGQESATSICGLATRTCVVLYKAKPMGGCEIVENGDCLEARFTTEMNDLCRSLGDCGLEANYIGDYTKNVKLSKAKGFAKDYIAKVVALAVPTKGKYADIGKVEKYIEAAGVNGADLPGSGGALLGEVSSLIYSSDVNADNSGSGTGTGNVISGEVVGGGVTGMLVTSDPGTTFVPYKQALSTGGVEQQVIGSLFNSETGTFMRFVSAGESLPFSAGSGAVSAGSTVSVASALSGTPASSVASTALSGMPATSTVTGAIDLGTISGTGAGTPSINLGTISGSTPAAATKPIAPTPGMGGFIGGVIGGVLGNMIGSALAKSLGLSSTGSFLMSTGMGLVGSALGTAAGAMVTGGASSFAQAMSMNIILGINPTMILIVGAIMVIASLFFGGGECPPKKVTFTCEPWQPPAGAGKCSMCNNDPEKPCSEYRCQSLGAGCEIVNKGTGNEKCDAAVDDGKAPEIKVDGNLIMAGNNTYENTSTGFKVTNQNGGCLNAFDMFAFGINTNELSQCKFDLSEKTFDEMDFNFGSNYYSNNHSMPFMLPNLEGCGLNWTGDLTLYAKCRDRFGHESGYYTVDMCVSNGRDTKPAMINGAYPGNASLISFNKTSQDLIVFTNEPSECRYSSQNKDYELMENQMQCENGCEDQTVLGFGCSSTIPLNTTNNIYIRCKDQPWLNESNDRNANQESLNLNFRKVSSKIAIDEITPDNEIETSTELTNITLNVKTAGGGNNHHCKYSFSGYDNMIDFNDFDGNKNHNQEFNGGLLPGDYRIYVECSDETGDTARNSTVFSIFLDDASPLIIRVYKQGSSMTIMTNEYSNCVYSTKSCNYDFDNATEMYGIGTEHSFEVEAGKKYYIKCADAYGTKPYRQSCSFGGIVSSVY